MKTTMASLDPVQCPLTGRRLIEASAGTGKTYTICLLYLRAIIERNLTVRDLLVVSFTNAATAELKERVRARLVETLSHLRDGSTGKIDQGLADLLTHYHAQGRDTAVIQKHLAAAIAGFDDAPIHTIHGFCKRIFDDTPFTTGMPLEVELTADDAEMRAQLTADLYREWLSTTTASDATVASLWQGKTLRDLGIEVKRCLAKPIATLRWPAPRPMANAAERQAREIRYLALQQRWRDEYIDIIAALNSSAPLLNASVYKNSSIANAARQWDTLLQAPTFHLACRPETQKDCKLKLFGWASICAKTNAGKAKNAKTAEVMRHAFFPAADVVLADLKARDEEAAQERMELLQFVVTEAPRRMAALKQAARVLSFDDLLKALHDRLTGADGAILASAIRKRFPLALVDEFQDTDPLQYGIFNAVYEADGTLLLVGDPKQAIYAFRNADLHVYMQARMKVSESYTLTHNQRSSGAYLEALNTLFGRNPNAFVLDGLNYHPLSEGIKSKKSFQDPGSAGGALQLWCLPGGDGGEVLSKTAARAASAGATAAEISRLLHGAREGAVTYGGRPLAAGDIAVIVPTHARGSEVRAALAQLGIGAVEVSRDSVYATDEARELACILDAVLAPNRTGLIRAALTTNLLGYTAARLLDLNGDDERLMAEFERFERYRTLWIDRGVGALLRQVVVDFGITERLLTGSRGERRLTNLRQLIELLQTAAAEHPAPDALRHWLQCERHEDLIDEVSQLRLESDRDLVQIVSIHASKGLEYPIVFCPTLWDDFLSAGKKRRGLAVEYRDDVNALVIDYTPSEDSSPMQARIDREVDAEKMRLLYVALTRAIHRAYLIVGPWAAKNSLKGAARSCLNWLAVDDAELPYDAFQAREANATEICNAWKRLSDACAHVSFALLPSELGVPLSPPAVNSASLTARVLASPMPRARRMGSFSALVHGVSHEAALKDRDARAQEEKVERESEPVPADDIRRFPRGARPGHCIHAVFEEADFTSSANWLAVINDALMEHPPDGREHEAEAQAAMLHSMLTHVVATPLAKGFTLDQVPFADRLVEWEFSLPVGRLEAVPLSRLLADYGYRMPPMRFAALEGYLRGFVDLIVRHAERFYVIDWKSTVLGERASDYGRATVEAAMSTNGYHLQHLLYTVALHRWLSLRLSGYDYDTHMGGTRYLFIRGVRPDWPDAGIYANRPPRALIEAISTLLDQSQGGA